MKQLHNIVAPLILFCLMAAVSLPVLAQEQEGETVAQQTQDEITPKEEQENTVDVKEIVFGHIGDSYEWHITTWGNTHITIPLPVIVYNIANDDSIASVTAAVWHNEDQSDLQWVELPQNEDGTYSTNVNIANFNFVLGEYHIHVYAVNTDGQQYFLGEGIGSVQ